MTVNIHRKIPFPRDGFLDQYGIVPDGYLEHEPETHHHVTPQEVPGVDHHWHPRHHPPELQGELLHWRPAWEHEEPFTV